LVCDVSGVTLKRSEDTEKRIIDAALELFVRKGYHGTSISEITQKVGLSKGALYAHFSSKGELLLHIIRKFKTSFIDQMIQTVNEHKGDALAKLHSTITFSSKFALENQDLCVFLTFLTTELKADVDFEQPLKNLYRDYQKFISQLIQHGIRQGLFNRDLDPDMAALAFMALHDGVLHQWVLNRNHIDGERYVKTFRTIFMEGLKVR
jgi:AcrR family transcriptional regulator